MPWGGARGQNLGHLGFFLIFPFSFHSRNHLYLNKSLLFRVYFLSVTSDYMVQYPRVGLGVKV